MNTVETRQALALATAAARAGGRELTRRFGTALTHATKGHLDFATEADIESERAILAVLRQGGPWPVTGEESGNSGAEARDGRRWYVDPLCGTVNFAHGIRFFCVNVGLSCDGLPEIGVSYDPASGEVFVGGAHLGAWLEDASGRQVALTPSASSGLVTLDFGHTASGEPAFQTSRLALRPEFSQHYAPVRFASSLAVPYVAAGRMAAFFDDMRDGDVHFAAPVAIACAAGATALDLAGNEWRIGANGIVVGATAEVAQHLLGMWHSLPQ